MLQLIASIALMYLVVISAGVWSTRKRNAQKEALANSNPERMEK